MKMQLVMAVTIGVMCVVSVENEKRQGIEGPPDITLLFSAIQDVVKKVATPQMQRFHLGYTYEMNMLRVAIEWGKVPLLIELLVAPDVRLDSGIPDDYRETLIGHKAAEEDGGTYMKYVVSGIQSLCQSVDDDKDEDDISYWRDRFSKMNENCSTAVLLLLAVQDGEDANYPLQIAIIDAPFIKFHRIITEQHKNQILMNALYASGQHDRANNHYRHLPIEMRNKVLMSYLDRPRNYPSSTMISAIVNMEFVMMDRCRETDGNENAPSFNVNAVGKDGRTLLMTAVDYKDVRMINILLKFKHLDVKRSVDPTGDHATILEYAVLVRGGENVKMVKTLLSHLTIYATAPTAHVNLVALFAEEPDDEIPSELKHCLGLVAAAAASMTTFYHHSTTTAATMTTSHLDSALSSLLST